MEVQVPVLLADEDEHKGHVATLELRKGPGSGRVVCTVGVDDAARLSAESAASLVLGKTLASWDLEWSLRLLGDGPPLRFFVDGDSLGLSMAVAAQLLKTGRSLPPNVGFTARVDRTGTLSPVGAMALKLQAAKQAGLTRIYVAPGEESPGTQSVASLSDLWLHLWPRRLLPIFARKFWLGGGFFLPALVNLMGPVSSLDRATGQALFGLVQGTIPARRTVLLTLPATECRNDVCTTFRNRRDRITELLRQLLPARPVSVSFDLSWIDADPADDDLAAAIRALHAAHIPVILPLRWGTSSPIFPGSPSLRALFQEEVVRWAHAFGEGEDPHRLAPGRIKLREWDGQRYVWHAAVETVDAWSPDDGAPSLEEEHLRIGTVDIPTVRGRMSLRPVEPSPCFLWTDPGWTTPGRTRCQPLSILPAEVVAGKSVWIGVEERQDQFSLFGNPVAGVEVQAAATEVIAAGAAPRSLPGFVLVLLLTLLGALGRFLGRPGLGPDTALLLAMMAILGTLTGLGWQVPVVSAFLGGLMGIWTARSWVGTTDGYRRTLVGK